MSSSTRMPNRNVASCKWVIKNFSDSWYSATAPFGFPVHNGTKFQLKINPSFHSDHLGYNCVTTSVNVLACIPDRLEIKYRMSILNARGVKWHGQDGIVIFKKPNRSGHLLQYNVPRIVLMDPAYGMLLNDTLTVMCELELVVNEGEVRHAKPVRLFTSLPPSCSLISTQQYLQSQLQSRIRLLQCPYERDDRSFCDEHMRLVATGKCPFGHRWQEGGPAAGQRSIPRYICTDQLYDRCQAPLVTVGQSQGMRRCGQGFHPTRAQLANLDTLNVVLVNVLGDARTSTDQCAICFAPLGTASPGRFGHLRNCEHVFCARCLVEWLDQAHAQCPVCRAAVCGEMLIWSCVLTNRQEKAELFGLLRNQRVPPQPEVQFERAILLEDPGDEVILLPAPFPPPDQFGVRVNFIEPAPLRFQ